MKRTAKSTTTKSVAPKKASTRKAKATGERAVKRGKRTVIVMPAVVAGEAGDELGLPEVETPSAVTPAAPVNSIHMTDQAKACIAAVRTNKALSAALAHMSDEELAADLNRVTRGRGCKPESAVTYYRAQLKKAPAVGEAAA